MTSENTKRKKRTGSSGSRSQSREGQDAGGKKTTGPSSADKIQSRGMNLDGKSSMSVGSRNPRPSGGVVSTIHAGSTGSAQQRNTPGTSDPRTKPGRDSSSTPQFRKFSHGANGAQAVNSSVPSSIGHSPGEGSNRSNDSGGDASSLLTAQTPSLYNPQEKDPKREALEKKLQLQEYVRHELFPRWKFFTCPSQLVYDAQKGSIVLKICDSLNVSELGRMTWWERNKGTVVQILNMRRNEVTAYVKKRFIGKKNL
jgi:hypothetical protein